LADPLKLYRFLLKLYPARFREEYGTPLEQQFFDEYREAGGRLARFAFWTRTVRDLAISIPLELAREMRQDVCYSVRIYSRRPGVTFLAVAAMALAIGATTGVFSVVNALLLRSLPFRSPERMVQLGVPFVPPETPPAFHAWRTHSDYLEDAAMYSQAEMNLSGAAGSARVKVSETSFNFFSALGCEPEIGRSFVPGEDVEGKNSVAVISYGLWQQFFGGDPRALGSTIHLNSLPLTVVGIARPGLDYPAKTAVWTPSVFNLARIPKSGVVWRETFGRLKPGLTLARAQSIFDADREHLSPGALKQEGADRVKLIPLREQLAGPVRRASLVLLGAVSFVLLIACANVANLLLTRITERRKELALRASLGASRARLTQQLITESVLLTGLSAAAGMLVANWAARLATAAQPAQLTAQNYTILDWRVLGFAAGLALLTGFVFGVLPAFLIGRLQPTEDLVRAPSDGSNSRVRRLRSALVALQVALTLVLLGGSIVLGRSFLKALGADLGYRTDHVITMNVSLAGTRFDKPELRAQYYRDALDRLRNVPGVEAAGGIDALPLATNAFMGMDAELDSSHKIEFSCVMWATPDYFRTMRTAIVAGRDFSSRDQQGAGRVAIVNEEFARDAGGTQAVLGHKVKSVFGAGGSGVTIVGIARTVHYHAGPGDNPMPILYLPPDQNPYPFMTLVARVHGRTEAYLPIARNAIQSVDRQVPVFDAKTLDQRLAESLARPRFYTTAVLFFGGFALLLAVIGVYGVASYSIIQRTHELGVRIAIGASAERMRFLLLRQSLLPVAIGMAAGVAGTFGLGRFLEHLMDTAQRVDGATCGVAAALLTLIAAMAVWSATQRILRLDPMQVLRAE
jgi:predicted permease